MTSTIQEPLPRWEEAPRYCPSKTFPAYRFTPGLNAHPTAQAHGHSYGHDIANEVTTHIPPEQWADNPIYLYGVDLYHQGYLWESHEAWEALWHLTDKEGPEGQFLQGLIQNSAAQLKVHLKQWKAARHLSHEAWERLYRVLESDACSMQHGFMGLPLAQLIQDMQTHYGPLWVGEEKVLGVAPQLVLKK